ncbi:metallopeptidase family protein [Quadrisphaera sp. DSM 44207]|uniref:metallopeptidase family protein n=1 Tax=Quadrisphaera sp. DSM 44207 TaxID=1881057 RepID=UPI00088E1194|nr:metallopeptidase family protein [Quadrisphaera sp. DSM 44207]SDQ09408.1 Zinicin-like metallopeptidase [Quadrisphaera sp. DSM 44207]
MAAPSAPRASRTRRRDRHGRGLRGPLLPVGVPGARTRAERFDDVVLGSVERLERRWAEQLSQIEFAVEDVPPPDAVRPERDEVPLGRFEPAADGAGPRVVVYRRPLETRGADEPDLAALVHEVVVEQVASALGVEPEQVDPRYPGDDR